MKLTTTFFTLSLALAAIATPLGDRAVFRRHTGVPANNARRYILQSRMDAPPACLTNAPSTNSTGLPDLSNSTVVDPSVTDVPTNTTDDGSIPNADPTGNATDTTDTTTTDVPDDTSADNSTSTDSSNSTDASTRRRRGLKARFAQFDLIDLAVEWQNLCLESGGDIFTEDSPCVELAGVGGINALLADADPCAQQDIADSMITFAKSSGVVNSDDLIAFALKYRRHPRSAVNILGVVPSSLYCLQAPTNPELVGVSNDQLDGVNTGLFGSPNLPMVPFGAQGTCPLGSTPDVSTCSCVPGTTDASSPSNGTVDDSTVSDPSATDSVDDSTATATDAPTPTDSATATDSSVSDAAAPTDSTDGSSDPNASVTPDNAAIVPAPTDDGPNAQPTDISGNVNDPNGRRK